MKQCVKRYLAVILTLAMVFTMIPSTVVRAEGEEGGTVGTVQTVKADKFVIAGSESGNPTDTVLIGTNTTSETGDEKSAAMIGDKTAILGSGDRVIGSSRVGAFSFALPKGIDTELIANATVAITVYDGNGNMRSRNQKTKAALFQVDQEKYAGLATDGTANAPGATFPAKSGYTEDKTVFSEEWIESKGEQTDAKVTFDVTNWVKESLQNQDQYAIFRLQTVIQGFTVYHQGDNMPTLSITTLTEQEAADQVAAGLALPTTVSENLTLPTTGNYGTAIAWESKNPGVIGNDGVLKDVPAENTEVEFVATVTKGTATKSRSIKVTVIGSNSDTVLAKAIASYDFGKFQKDGDNALTDGSRSLKLETAGNGKKPELAEDSRRGQVLSLTEQNYGDRGFALLPSNPFAGKSVENGLTLSFWTKSKGNPANNRCLIDFEVAPATNGRAGTVAVNQYYVYWNTTDQNQKFMDFHTNNLELAAANGWVMVTMAITTDGITFYRNNQKISHDITAQFSTDYEQMIKDMAGTSGLTAPENTNVRIGASLATYWHCAGAWIDDISFYDKALSAEEVASLYDETVVPVELSSVTVTGPKTVDEEKTIQLSRTLSPADTTVNTTTTWTSSNENILTVDANGKVKGLNPGTATVTATVAGISSEPYEITVNDVVFTEELPEGKYITVYSTTKAFYANTANLDQETRSVYMAISKDGKEFEVLNNGGGVIFSKNTSGTLRVTEPKICKEDGKFTVVAPDANASRGLHKFTSQDGVNYYDDEIVQSYDISDAGLKKSNFKLMLHGENILDTDDSITLGNALKLTDEEYTYIVNKLGTVVNNGLEKLDDIDATSAKNTDEILGMLQKSVNATFTDGSVQKFNIDWSEAFKGVDLSKEGTYELTGKVIQTQYINKLKELNGSSRPDDDPENISDDPDNYDEETGTVYYDKTKFVEGMADPCIYWDEQTGYYYMTGSYFPEEGDAIDGNDKTEQYDRVVLRRARTLEGLQSRKDQVTIWKVGNQGFTNADGSQADRGHRYIWAPEIHRVGDYWVVYFTESHSSLFDIYCHVLVLPGDQDPYETALTASNQASQWKDYKMTSNQASDPFSLAFCLDMTYFKDAVNGKSYVIWAGKPTAAYQGSSTDLFIATVDESQPWIITSPATRLTKSDYGWERVRYCVNEGATVLQNDGNVFMCYSVSGTGSEYAIGMCNAKGGADLLDISNWTKSPYPLLTSRDVDGEEGPGHNSFTVDQDGNAIFVYHARPTSHNYQKCGKYNGEPLNDPCRHARLKRVHWAADGMPILKMTYENELLEENKTVKVNVKVGAGVVVTTPVTGITLDKNTLSLAKGAEADLTATVKPDDATNKTVTWSSDKESVATVANGKVKAVGAGTAVITAKAGSVTATCTVTVTVPVDSVALDKNTLSLVKGAEADLTATVSPSDATDKTVAWSTDRAAVATVANGKVKAVGAGTATITATAGGKTATCTVTVTVPVTNVTLDQTALNLQVGGTADLTATVAPSDATDKAVTWSSDKESVATVVNGKVTAIAAGTATITAKAGDKTAACVVTVTNPVVEVTGVTLDKKSITMYVKDKAVALKATVAPANATNKAVTWESSNDKVAKVSANGSVTPVGRGTATITVKTANGKTAACKVTVKVHVSRVKLSKTKATIGEKESLALKATVSPSTVSSSDKKITWKSSNTKLATVSSKGVVKAKKAGTVKITARADGKSATCTVTIKKAPTKITVKKASVSLKRKGTYKIKYTLKPSGARNKVTYKSNKTKVAKVSSSGVITGVRKGTAKITVKTYNGKKATITVRVK